MKFELGQVVVTPKAQEVLQQWGQTTDTLLARHRAGDWGDVTEDERRVNDEGLVKRYNLVSAYLTPHGHKVTVFTKSDRSLTLIHISPDHRAERAEAN